MHLVWMGALMYGLSTIEKTTSEKALAQSHSNIEHKDGATMKQSFTYALDDVGNTEGASTYESLHGPAARNHS